MDICRTLGSGSLSVTAMLDFSGLANISIHGLGEDDTATGAVVQLPAWRVRDVPNPALAFKFQRNKMFLPRSLVKI